MKIVNSHISCYCWLGSIDDVLFVNSVRCAIQSNSKRTPSSCSHCIPLLISGRVFQWFQFVFTGSWNFTSADITSKAWEGRDDCFHCFLKCFVVSSKEEVFISVLMSKNLEQCRDDNLNKQLHVGVVETNTLKRVDFEAAASDCCIMRIFSQKYSSSSLTSQ